MACCCGGLLLCCSGSLLCCSGSLLCCSGSLLQRVSDCLLQILKEQADRAIDALQSDVATMSLDCDKDRQAHAAEMDRSRRTWEQVDAPGGWVGWVGGLVGGWMG